MSRAYRIQVKESLRRDVTAEDSITSSLEILEVLPRERMAQLLEGELLGRGFEKDGDKLVRRQEGVTIEVDPATGEVTVRAREKESLDLEAQREGRGYDDVGPSSDAVRKQLSGQLKQELEQAASREQQRLQGQATDRLERELCDLQPELEQAVNHVTAEALKEKARSMGQVKDVHEDPQTGSLTITVEV